MSEPDDWTIELRSLRHADYWDAERDYTPTPRDLEIDMLREELARRPDWARTASGAKRDGA